MESYKSTKVRFMQYLRTLGISYTKLIMTSTAFEAQINKDITNYQVAKNFTNCYLDSKGNNWARLGTADIHNDAITKGFFDGY